MLLQVFGKPAHGLYSFGNGYGKYTDLGGYWCYFLLFALGLEFSFKKIVKVGGAAIIAACTIIFCMILLGVAVGTAFGWKRMDCIFWVV